MLLSAQNDIKLPLEVVSLLEFADTPSLQASPPNYRLAQNYVCQRRLTFVYYYYYYFHCLPSEVTLSHCRTLKKEGGSE